MKHDIPVRIVVISPPQGAVMRVQRGRDELLDAVNNGGSDLTFEFDISVDIAGQPNFLGSYAHGPKNGRFIYVNSGSCARQHPSKWNRRAKISLMSVTADQVTEILNGKGSVLETSFQGTGKDGGPTCASVKGIEWKVVKE